MANPLTPRAESRHARENAELRKKLAVMHRMTVEEIVAAIRRSGDIDYGTSEPSWAVAQWIWDRFRNDEPRQTRGREEHHEMPDVPAEQMPAEFAEMRTYLGRALSRVNKLKVVSSVRQQEMLDDAKDYLVRAMEAYSAYEDRLMDEEWE